MSVDLSQTTIRSFPHAFLDKRSQPVLIKPLDEIRCEQLLDMYLGYLPRNSFSGLPPLTDGACRQWVLGMITSAANLVALSFEHGLVGHVGLFPIDTARCEMLVVVSPAHQRIGIGSELIRCAIQAAHELGFETIRLNVEARNRIARHVYEKCGFVYLSTDPVGELDMGLDLRQYRDTDTAPVRDFMCRRVVTIHADMSCKVALIKFLEEDVPTLPVIDDRNHVVGIISETDLLVEENIHKRVREVLSREVVTVREGDTVGKVVSLFRSRRLRCLPVVDRDGKLAGVVGRRDVLKYYLKCYAIRQAGTHGAGST